VKKSLGERKNSHAHAVTVKEDRDFNLKTDYNDLNLNFVPTPSRSSRTRTPLANSISKKIPQLELEEVVSPSLKSNTKSESESNNSNSKNNQCCICLQELETSTTKDGDKIPRCSSCNNGFHPGCLTKHMEVDAERRGFGRVHCPLCRNRLIIEVTEQEMERLTSNDTANAIRVPFGVRRESVFR